MINLLSISTQMLRTSFCSALC